MKARSLLASLLVMTSACTEKPDVLPYYITRELTPEWLTPSRVADLAVHRVGSFKLVSNDGSTFTEKNLDGRLSIVHFFFTECNGVCPKTQPNIAWVLRSLPRHEPVQVISQSVLPEHDSINALNVYAREHRITDTRWHLVTGDRSEIERLASESYYANLKDGRSYGVDDLVHTETVYLVDGERRIRGVYNGTLRLDMEQLRDDIRALSGG